MRPNPEQKQSLFDPILDISSQFDWISPVIAFIQNWQKKNDPAKESTQKQPSKLETQINNLFKEIFD